MKLFTKNIALLSASLSVLCSLSVTATDRQPYEDHTVFAINKLAGHATLFPFQSTSAALATEKEQSSNFILLNGLWQFDWQKSPKNKPAGFQQVSFDDSAWSQIPVPGNWETEGFGYPIYLDERFPFTTTWPDAPSDYNPIGSYRKPFVLPKAWQDQQVFLHISAAKSSLDVWLNGEKVGFSQGSKTPAEFDLTPFISNDNNLLALQIRRWSDASYLESQDMLRISGIERDVYLYATNKQQIFDFHAKPTLNKDFSKAELALDVTLKNHQKTASKQQLEFQLLDPIDDMKMVMSGETKLSLKSGAENNVTLTGKLANPRLGTAETPNLYTLLITLKDKQGNHLETIRDDIGFRHIEITNSQLTVNGKAITIRGVDRHETDPLHGHVVTKASMEKDIKLMK